MRQFETLLCQPTALANLPNINQLWARLMIEELCRLGVNTFCIAPGAVHRACHCNFRSSYPCVLEFRVMTMRAGSRSSPLTMAVALQPTARLIPCIDERSLAFWALGYGRATRCETACKTVAADETPTLPGIEPGIFGFVDQRLIHWATESHDIGAFCPSRVTHAIQSCLRDKNGAKAF